eukprot:CFRG4381T1
MCLYGPADDVAVRVKFRIYFIMSIAVLLKPRSLGLSQKLISAKTISCAFSHNTVWQSQSNLEVSELGSTSAPRKESIASPSSLQGGGIISDRDLRFLLEEVFDVNRLLERPLYAQHSIETINDYLSTITNVAKSKFLPLNTELDTKEPQFKDGRACVPKAVGDAIATLSETGYMAAGLPEEHGGMQLPYIATMASEYIVSSACLTATSYPMLTIGVANVLSKFGSESQRERFLPHLLSGRFMGTMCLSEPQAGSSLADITTSATPMEASDKDQQMGQLKYNIKGTKMWISGGEQDFTDNIVHLVLAKIRSPESGNVDSGVKGISLFIVPKHDYDFNKELPSTKLREESTNGISLVGLNHKMGWKGTTNTILSFGESDRTTGYLVGESGRGLEYMFMMMNGARIGVGLAAVALANLGYRASLEYAIERKQGRTLPPARAKGEKSVKGPTPQTPIINHADVRRMLMAQKCYTEGALSLCLYAAYLVDEAKSSTDANMKKYAAEMLDLLTPVVKAWPSEWCLESNKWAIQVLGGCGYTKDFPVEQYYRDNRLNMIHEGTNGIQSLDLLGRKVAKDQGKQAQKLLAAMVSTCGTARATNNEKVAVHARDLESAVNEVRLATKTLLTESKSADELLCNSHEYLNMFGTLVVSWMWLRQAVVATEKLNTSKDLSETDRSFYEGKQLACEFFYRYETPIVTTKARLVSSMDDTLLRVDAAHL